MKAKKNILFISYDGMTDPLGQSQVIPYLAALTEYGYEFTILSCDKPKNYADHKGYVMNLLKPYSIKWISIPYHKKPPVLSSYFDFLMLKKKVRQLHKEEKFDMVHTRPGLPTLVALWMKKKYGIKFLNDIRGFWADERVDGGMWNIKNLLFKTIYKWFKKKEYECLEIADYNTCLTIKAKEEMLSWAHISNQPVNIEVIPCSVDMNLFDPAKINYEVKDALRKELHINDNDFIISYLGSIGGWYLTEEMMQFCKYACSKIPNTKILFISPYNHSIIAATATKFGIPPEKIIVKHGKRHEVPALLSFSNYSIFFIKPCYSKMSSSPTKHGEIMAMGIPVITNAGVGDVQEIVENYQSGFVLEKLNHENYIHYSGMLFDANFDPDKIRDGATKFYSLENAVQKYLKVYRHILKETQTLLPTA
jgi:glycosyltransferase involved in cell wall biosynthesis